MDSNSKVGPVQLTVVLEERETSTDAKADDNYFSFNDKNYVQ